MRSRISSISPPHILVYALVGVLLLSLVGVSVVVADTEYDLTVSDATDTPTETVEIDQFVRDEFTIDAIAVREPGESLTADVSVPDDVSVETTQVDWMDSDQQLVETTGTNEEGEATFGSDVTEDLEPGTYSLLLVDDSTEAIHPVVISGYDITVSNPDEAEVDSEITITSEVVQTEADSDPSAVEVVVWNDETATRENATAADGDEYTANVSLDNHEAGEEYSVYVTAHGDEEFRGEKEILALGEGTTLTVTEADDDDGDDSGGQQAGGQPIGGDDDDSDDSDETDADDDSDGSDTENGDDGADTDTSSSDDGTEQDGDDEQESDDADEPLTPDDDGETMTEDDQPGFGVLASVLALIVTGLAARRIR